MRLHALAAYQTGLLVKYLHSAGLSGFRFARVLSGLVGSGWGDGGISAKHQTTVVVGDHGELAAARPSAWRLKNRGVKPTIAPSERD